MTKKLSRLTAAVLSLALFCSVLSLPASAVSISTGVVRASDSVVPSGMTLWLTVGAVEYLEPSVWLDTYEEEMREGKTVPGTEYTYDGYQAATLDWNAFAGLSQESGDTIYWYIRTDYEKWIKGLKTATVDWTDGTITLADGARYTPCSSSKASDNALTLSVGGFAVQGTTALLIAGGVAAVAIGVKLYEDPTILQRAQQSAQDFFGDLAAGLTDTVQSWLAPAEADGAKNEAALAPAPAGASVADSQ